MLRKYEAVAVEITESKIIECSTNTEEEMDRKRKSEREE